MSGQVGAVAVARHLGDDGSQVAAGAVARDRDEGGVGADALGMGGALLGDPLCGGVGVFSGGGIAVFGRQAVIDGDDGAADAVGQRAADGVVGVQVADDPAAAVVVDDGRQRGFGEHRVETDRDLAVGARDAHVGDVMDRFGLSLRAQGGGGGAGFRRRERVERRRAFAQLEDGLRFGGQGHGTALQMDLNGYVRSLR